MDFTYKTIILSFLPVGIMLSSCSSDEPFSVAVLMMNLIFLPLHSLTETTGIFLL